MKKFYFPLDTVLDYKEQILESLRGEHAAALARVRACEQELEQLEEEHRLCAEEFLEHRLRGMKINEIYTYEHYLESIGIKIKNKLEQLDHLKELEEKKKEQVVEAKKETASIDKLKEKKLEEYRKAVQKQEELSVEEFVSTRTAVEKLYG